jgi:diguanylate cyclase (GGDEF)-like protein
LNRDSLPVELFTALLVVWVAGSVFAMSQIDQTGSAPIAVALIGLIVVSAFALPVRGASALVGLLSVFAYGGFQIFREISQGGSITVNRFFLAIVFAGLAMVTVFLVGLVSARFASIYTVLRRNNILIDELTLRDDTTTTVKRRYADQILQEEVQRSRRFSRTLTFGLLAIEGVDRILEERGRDGLNEILGQCGRYLVSSVRTIDTISRHDVTQFGLILPETPLTGAQVISERLVNGLAATPGVVARVGLAEFPEDAATADDLIREAQQALAFAQGVQLKVASRNLLQGELSG